MDKKAIGKYLMMALGAAFTLGSYLISEKNQESQIKEAVAEQVAEEMKKLTKGF